MSDSSAGLNREMMAVPLLLLTLRVGRGNRILTMIVLVLKQLGLSLFSFEMKNRFWISSMQTKDERAYPGRGGWVLIINCINMVGV